MKSASNNKDNDGGRALLTAMRRAERREWWLWLSAFLITLLLTVGLVSFMFPILHAARTDADDLMLSRAVRGLIGLVLLFDVYVVYQQLQIYRIRRRLFEREELFRLISENAEDMIAVVDAEGHRLYNSPSYERLLGYGPEELQQSSPFEQVHPDDRKQVEESVKEARNSGTATRIEYRMRHKDGSWRVFESTASAVLDSQGKVDKLVIVNRDATVRRRLEEQFRQGQKMEAVGRLSGGIAHDFNNLLGVIIGYCEVLEEKIEVTHELRGCVEEILRAGRRAATLTRQLLAFSRQQVLEPKVLDLNAVIQDTEKMLRRLIREDVELNTELETGLDRVKADQGQVEQVILNLAVNARDAMPDGGKLTIKTENILMDEAQVRRYSYPFKPGRYVLLTVSDTGMGMDSATQAHIFEPFFTTKEKGKGTGLGLATVYGVIKQSDGYIELHSELNVGTTFKIFLPQVDGPIEEEKAPGMSTPLSQQHETVLLVEDEDSLRTLARSVLEKLGYTVIEATNGTDACSKSEQRQGTIHLLLTDVVMPGMNGRALAEKLAGQRPQLRVLYMSGYTGQAVGHGVLAPGSHFLPKPFTRESLGRKVREVLDEAVQAPLNEAPQSIQSPLREVVR